MRDRRLASNYASALLSLLPHDGEAESAGEFLEALAEAAATQPEFHGLLRDPAISKDDRRKVLFALADARGAGRTVRNFLGVIADHNRTSNLPDIADAFRTALEERQGIVAVQLTTARPLDDELRRRAAATLERKTGRRVRLSCKVDPRILGGAVAQVGSSVHDGSLKAQLLHLRDRMAQG